MTTVLAIPGQGRCDARCHDAKHEKCTCICGGVNHSIGREQAAENAATQGEELLRTWRKEHDEPHTPAATQLMMIFPATTVEATTGATGAPTS